MTEQKVVLYFNCKLCALERPAGESMESWARIKLGWTVKGLAVHCVRHNKVICALDFLGQKILFDPAPTPAVAPPEPSCHNQQ